VLLRKKKEKGKKKRISIGNYFEEGDFYPDAL
jgi:hypothetical protein